MEHGFLGKKYTAGNKVGKTPLSGENENLLPTYV